MASLAFNYADLYPAMGGLETSQLVQPDVDDQDALVEDRAAAEVTDAKRATSKQILLAVVMIGCLAVFFGGVK